MSRRASDRAIAAIGALLATAIVAVALPLAGGVFAQEPPTPAPSPPQPGATATSPGAPAPGPGETPEGGPTPEVGPTGPSPTPAGPPLEVGGTSITDTEYVSVPIDAGGNITGNPLLKDWLRVRGPAGARIPVSDPAVLQDVRPLSGSPAPEGGESLDWMVRVPDEQFRDLYYQGSLQPAGEGLWETAEGPRALPIEIDVAYYTGTPGAESRVTPDEFAAARGPAKIVFTVQNNTRQMQEVTYNDVQTKKDVTAVAPVWTPYVVKIGPVFFPDTQFDRVQTDGHASRVGNGTEVTWTLDLAPPDYPAKQTAIAQFLIARPELPELRIAAQPQYPPARADALGSEGIQFQKGRRSFLYDVFDLFRANLISLTGLFGLLDDAFSNLALPLVAPEKGNREAGSFDDPNQLWALWTLAKGMEQLNRATDVLDYSLQLARNGLKGEIGTLSQMRHLLGKSTDPPAASTELLETLPPDLVEGLIEGIENQDPAAAEEPIQHLLEEVVAGSIWQNIKDLEFVLGCTDCGTDTQRYLPEAPISVTPSNPTAGLIVSVIRLKLALFETNLAALQKEDHQNQMATLSGVSNTAESSFSRPGGDWRKFTTITFPFGQEEIADGLWHLKVDGIDLIQAALGNKDQPNSLIWAMHVLTDGMESLSDSFHQLGSTWRYLADSLQNFGIFGVETAKNTLQLDINNIDLRSAQRAAAARRVTDGATTFMGSPKGTKKLPVDTQFVLVFTTDPERAVAPGAWQTTFGKFLIALAFALVILVLLAYARFRWYLI